MSNFDDATIKYITLIDLEHVLTIRQESKLANNALMKLEISRYNNESDNL